jgi:MFS family permease
MRIVAVSLQIFDMTGSTVAVGILGLVELIPLIVFSIVGGTVADRAEKRRVIGWTQIGLMVSSGALWVLALSEAPSLLAIYALCGLASAFQAFDRPARTSLMPRLVREELIPAALALRQVVYQVTMIVGPLIGGALLAATDGDFATVYLIDTVSFVAALVSVYWLPRVAPADDIEETPWQSIKEGLRYSFRTPLISSVLVIDLIAMIFGMPRAAFPELARVTFGGDATVLGLLFAAPSAGALLAALSTGWVGRIRARGRAVIWSVAVWGFAIALAGLSVFSLWLTLLFLAIAGAADVISAVFRGTIVQTETPDHLRGRVNAVNLMVVTGGPRVGDLETGLVAGAFGAPASIVIGGAACLAGVGILARTNPALREYLAGEDQAGAAAPAS